jgi:glucan 1,3-beta-glucosidase
MAWFQIISGSSNLYIYGSGFWTFFNDDSSSCGSSCQTNAVDIASTTSLHYYGLNTRSNTNLVYYNGAVLVTQNNNPGGWGAVVAAFLWDT